MTTFIETEEWEGQRLVPPISKEGSLFFNAPGAGSVYQGGLCR